MFIDLLLDFRTLTYNSPDIVQNYSLFNVISGNSGVGSYIMVHVVVVSLVDIRTAYNDTAMGCQPTLLATAISELGLFRNKLTKIKLAIQ